MTRPTRTRLADLRRIKAWPLLSWAGLSGLIRLDLDLLAAKDLGGMSASVRQLWPEELERLWETARRLGWSYYWARSVIDQFVPAVIAWSQATIPGIDAEILRRLRRGPRRGHQRVGHHAQAVARTAVRPAPAAVRTRPAPRAAQTRPVRGLGRRAARRRPRYSDPPGHGPLREHPGRGTVTVLSGRTGQRPHPLRDIPRREVPRHRLARPARTPPHRGLPGLEPDPDLARPGRPRPAGLGRGGARRGADRPELPRRHHLVGLGRPAPPPAHLRQRRAPPATAAAPGASPRRRCRAHGRSSKPR